MNAPSLPAVARDSGLPPRKPVRWRLDFHLALRVAGALMRVKRRKQSPIRVVVGNPPYSSGQTSENDSNKNLK